LSRNELEMVEAAGVELDRFSRTGLIRRIPAKLDPLKPLDSLKCSRAGTKQVQEIARARHIVSLCPLLRSHSFRTRRPHYCGRGLALVRGRCKMARPAGMSSRRARWPGGAAARRSSHSRTMTCISSRSAASSRSLASRACSRSPMSARTPRQGGAPCSRWLRADPSSFSEDPRQLSGPCRRTRASPHLRDRCLLRTGRARWSANADKVSRLT
jgi:hypothetical protein